MKVRMPKGGKDGDKLKRRELLSGHVNKEIQIQAIYGGTHLAKGFLTSKTILLKNVKSGDKFIDDHMWITTPDYGLFMRFEKFVKGDALDILGKVKKYKKMTTVGKCTDFTIDVIDVKKEKGS